MMLRRSFGTIHEGHCPPNLCVADLYEWLCGHLNQSEYHAGALALEETEQGNLHIQFYVEHKRKRTSTLARDFLVSTEAVFDRVKDAEGAWDYCSGLGKHSLKPALARYTWGTPVLYGGSASSDLKTLVDMVIEGETLDAIMRAYPYAYAVHRARLIPFCMDWNNRNDSKFVGFRGQ